MNTQELVTKLSLLHPPEVIYEISSETVISAIVRRMGEEALELSPEDLQMAKAEVKAAIEHHLDERDYIDMGLDASGKLSEIYEYGKFTILYERKNEMRTLKTCESETKMSVHHP